MVQVIVGTGDSQALFTVYASVFKQRSTFFESALSGRWNSKDGVRGPIKLPDDESEVFERYLKCVYLSEARVRLNSIKNGDPDDLSTYDGYEDDQVTLLYTKAYVLADKLGDYAAANMFMDTLIDDVSSTCISPSSGAIAYAWEHTPQSSPLRRLCVHLWVSDMIAYDYELSEPEDDDLPRGFVLQLISEMVQVSKGEDTAATRIYREKLEFFDSVRARKEEYHQYDRLCPKPSEKEGKDCV